jgi:hypothetical protein
MLAQVDAEPASELETQEMKSGVTVLQDLKKMRLGSRGQTLGYWHGNPLQQVLLCD